MTLQLGKHGQQGPNQAILEAHQTVATPGRRLEGDPAFQHAFGLRRRLAGRDAPVGGFGGGKLRLQHVAHLVPSLDGLEVPGEGDEVAPVAFFREQIDGIVDAAGLERGAERIEKRLNAAGGGFVEHLFLLLLR